ncbi:MAG: type II toxin-antitoxin system VapB family antitoxin [Cyanobacteriota bacterium]|nr:type II toxin-antitoxin system VapB family antitoxin [Cyanobacteriota bacterium]
MQVTKILKNSDFQSVILPEEFNISQSEVYIKKIDSVIVLISKENSWESLFESLSLFSEDFMTEREQPPLDVRETWE